MAHRYDCGRAGALTVADIAARSGCCEKTIRERLRRGWRGADLLRPPMPHTHQQKRKTAPPRQHPWRRSNACDTARAKWSSVSYRARGKLPCSNP